MAKSIMIRRCWTSGYIPAS